MKKFAYLWLAGCLIGMAPSLLKGQEYHPMAVEGAHWIVICDLNQTLWRDWKYSFTIRGDTTVNGKYYKKVYREGFEFDEETKRFSNKIIGASLYGMMRDDTIQRKVYFIKVAPGHDRCPRDGEYLLFDFSAEAGDTLKWCDLDGLGVGVNFDGAARVDSIRHVNSQYFNSPRKALYTTMLWTIYKGTDLADIPVPIIEGFGYEIMGPFLDGSFLMDYCVGTNADCGLITSKINIQRPNLRVFPNPAAELLIIEGKGTNGWDFNNSFLLIVDLTGKVVKEQKFQSGQYSIDIAHIPAGFYLCSLINDKGIIYQTSFVKK